MQQEPRTDEEKAAIKLRDDEQKEYYEDRVIKKGNAKVKDSEGRFVLIDNMKEEHETIVGADGKPERVLKRVTGYKVSLSK